LLLDNGLGGFSADGREYVITVAPGRATPAPWSNVLANPHFGSVISESGRAYTWSENAHEFRLTPWSNDAVCDGSGEAFYLRDEESGQVWSPTPLPCPGANSYVCRHGFGYSVFEYSENGIYSELCIFVAADAAIKFSILKVRNDSTQTRTLSATGFVEWALGDLRSKTGQHITTEIDPNSGALCARNPYSTEFPNGIAFFDVDDTPHTFTGDRREFLGRNGSQRNPAALNRLRLSGKVGAAMDPCAAIQIPFELSPGQEREIVFRLGIGSDAASVASFIQKYRSTTIAHLELESVKKYWRHTLDAVQIETPDIALNMLANGWLVYQVIACRLWARSGYYQSGGAFGFRDQLQDAMALIHTEPYRLREQILLCASRQFVEGDVQHWWHPPGGRGVRTRCSDDYLWLPLATCRYVISTGDTGVLNESIQFLQGRAVNAGDESYYDLPGRADEVASLYQHCVRAIRHVRFGEHGLPLIGSGDWNDGMNLVGIEGRGESIWLGFFLCEVLSQFTKVASLQGDVTFAEYCAQQQTELRKNIETHGWDGEWYRRAYFDDGSVLGSAANTDCQIDSISQSWSVLSNRRALEKGSDERARSRLAMDAVYERLVRRDDAIVQLLDPPFDQSSLNPGYIKGYVPGVRENGGQYTHAAIWTAMAFAELGDSARAWELLRMINPVMHGLTAESIETYKVEPYVIAADVYAVAPHTGRGGWTWYTGSAGWMYRLIIESLLGLRLEVDKLYIAPCLPTEWAGFTIQYRFRETLYSIDVAQTASAPLGIKVSVDGQAREEAAVVLINDQHAHSISVTIGIARETSAPDN
jgi:cellobiose phosphorylase